MQVSDQAAAPLGRYEAGLSTLKGSDIQGSILACCMEAAPGKIRAVLLFGSTASHAAHTCSDIDVLCLLERGRRHRRTRSVQGRRLDIEYLSAHRLGRDLSPQRWRNNYRLIALYTGTILMDSDDLLATFQQRAAHLWAEGTAPLPSAEQRQLRKALGRSMHAAQALAARYTVVPQGQMFEELRLSWIFGEVAAAALRIRRRWVVPLWVAAKLPKEPEYAELTAIASRFYAPGASLAARAAELNQLAEASRAQLDVLRQSRSARATQS